MATIGPCLGSFAEKVMVLACLLLLPRSETRLLLDA